MQARRSVPVMENDMAGDLKNLPRIDDRSTTQVPLAEVMHKRLDQVTRLIEESEAKAAARAEVAEEWRHRTDQSITLLVEQVKSLAVSTEARFKDHSMRVAGESKTNLDQSSDIANVIIKVDALTKTQETQLAILTRLDAVAANPMVRRVAYAVGGAVLAYLASKGLVAR